MTKGHVQIAIEPDVRRTEPYVVKIPVVMEMYENPIANEENMSSVRANSCL